MCGIFGFCGKGSWKSSLLLQSLCIADEVRGRHSTGLVIQRGDNCFLQKKALAGKDFVAQGYTAFLFNREYSIALGHNRLATAGTINDRNAHPFGVRVNTGWCFGIHNGIVGETKKIASEYGVKEPEVDSEVVFRAIAKMQNNGMTVVEAIENITEFISADADFAFAYLNTSEKTVYLWRSPERPLCIIDARNIELGRWFCSTPDIFKNAWIPIAGALNDISNVTRFDVRPYRLYRVADDGIYEVEPVKDLKHRERKVSTSDRSYSYPSCYSCMSPINYEQTGRQLSLIDVGMDAPYHESKPLQSLTDDELYWEIFDIEARLDDSHTHIEEDVRKLGKRLANLYEEREKRGYSKMY